MLAAALVYLAPLLTPPDSAPKLPFAPRPVIDTLCSPGLWGRGYSRNGHNKAADYLRRRLQGAGASVSIQAFEMEAQVWPASPTLTVGRRRPALGEAWQPEAGCPPVRFCGKALRYDSLAWPRLPAAMQAKAALVFSSAAAWQRFRRQQLPLPGLAWIESGGALPAFSVARQADVVPVVYATQPHTPAAGQRVRFKAQPKPWQGQAHNVVARIPGTARPDSMLIVGAHYDHLGGLGKRVYFPGANDNATGTTLLLELATYLARHPLRYTVYVVGFSAEEAGLVGSQAFVRQWADSLPRVRFMLNLDLMGSGEDGATAVNAPAVQWDFDQLQALNARLQALPSIRPRRNAPNSDHYPFTQAGVPALFLYLQGPYKYYHSPQDKPRPELTLAGFEGTFHLCMAFLQRMAGQPAHR